MIIGFPKEDEKGELRTALVPKIAGRMVQKQMTIQVEPGLGQSIGIDDTAYKDVGAQIMSREALLASSDVIMRLKKPHIREVPKLKKGSVHVSFLDPFNETALIDAFVSHHISAISMEMIPRSTFAQKMDALSSQANLAGYTAVILAAQRLNKIFPMMNTPAGTIAPARVFVIGAGVAGLQAIATAKRLGARVEAFDTRPAVREQVHSLGAKFVAIDLGETGQTKDGYAKALTEKQLKIQREQMAAICARSDVVITTAQLFGRKAPIILTKDMIAGMQAGSVVVDMAVETGGNVEGSRLNETITTGGVSIMGYANLPAEAAVDASGMYAANLFHLMDTFWNQTQKTLHLDLSHDIIKGCLICHKGQLINDMIQRFRSN